MPRHLRSIVTLGRRLTQFRVILTASADARFLHELSVIAEADLKILRRFAVRFLQNIN